MGPYHQTGFVIKDWVIYIGLIAIALMAGASVVHSFLNPPVVENSQPTVLVCSDSRGDGRVIGISAALYIRPDGVYMVRGSDGLWQSYNKSSWEWCATLSLDNARQKGIVK